MEVDTVKTGLLKKYISENIYKFLTGKISNGWCFQKDKMEIECFEQYIDFVNYIYNKGDRKYILSDESKELKKWGKGKKGDSLDHLISLLKFKNESHVLSTRYLPAVNGYRILTEPKNKVGSRYGMKHAFAEPVMTIVKCSPVVSIKKEDFIKCFWKWSWDDGIYSYNGY